MASVSVIIPSYNRPELFEKALYSLLTQINQDFCVIVSDDKSTDENLVKIEELCNKFRDKGLDITLLKTTKHLGCGSNRRRALQYVKQHKTDYVMFLDSDDMYYPQTIERLVGCIETNKADIVAADITTAHSRDIYEIIKASESRTWVHGKIYRLQYLIDEEIDFCPELETNEDLCFNLIAYSKTEEIYNLNEALYIWKQDNGSITHSENTTTQQRKCHSIDFLDAVYYAWKDIGNIDKMQGTIIILYNYYQNAVAFKTLTNKHKEKIREILHDEQVIDLMVSIYEQQFDQLPIHQWVRWGEDLLFYGQSYGNWLMSFYTQDEVRRAIDKHKKEKEKKND